MSVEKSATKRRLGAIMFTDLVGYTSMSSRDESSALELLGELKGVLGSVFSSHEGRIVKTLGDGFLVEFGSAVEAVDCAVEVQRKMGSFNEGRERDEGVRVRIGIHVGDIVHSDGDVLGDAVNIASRVEPLAEPGGICITRQVVDQIAGKVKWQITPMGERTLRSLPGPMEVFKVLAQPAERAGRPGGILDPHRVAILPFSNLSPDPNDRYFADGMTEELISTVSKISGLNVISRASAMKYRDTTLPMDQVGRELRVGAILEGSVRKAGNKVRIAAQLLEVDMDRYVWSQSYDRDLTDILDVQEEIAKQVAEGLKLKLLNKDVQVLEKRSTSNAEAYTLYLKGRFYWGERTLEGTQKAVKYFEEAVRLDPKFASAYSGLADCYLIFADYGWMAPAAAGDRARDYALKALELDDSLAEAHASLGLMLVNHSWDFATGERELRKALELNPNYGQAFHWYGTTLMFQGRNEEALKLIEKAMELDPFSVILAQSRGVCLFRLGKLEEAFEQFSEVKKESPGLPSIDFWLSLVLSKQSRFVEAIEASKHEIAANGNEPGAKLDLAFIYTLAGNGDEAKRILDEVMALKDVYVSPTSLGIALLGLGKDDEAFGFLEKAATEHDSNLLYFRSLPPYEAFRKGARWQELERKIGLSSGPAVSSRT
ncbi:MAG: tetratricopeptide repeat protein [archaeon]|nr:MAG: tetratricopeptide repeat protein [archaeon]